MDNIQTTSYQFKICVTLGEYPQSVFYLEKIIDFISEYSNEEIEILNRLSNELLTQSKKMLQAIIAFHSSSGSYLHSHSYSNSKTELKYHNRIVLENYYKHAQTNYIELIERLLACLDKIILKLNEDSSSKALCHKIIGKLNAFLSVYSKDSNRKNCFRVNYLESALIHYKQSISIVIEHLNVIDPLRLRILLSYCKFISMYMKDYYRSMLFCMNIINEIHTKLNTDKDKDKDIEDSNEDNNKSLQIRLSKLKQFYNTNTEEYNKTVSKYFK